MSFLSSLATTLLQTYDTDLSQVTVVFPNKRAALFLNPSGVPPIPPSVTSSAQWPFGPRLVSLPNHRDRTLLRWQTPSN